MNRVIRFISALLILLLVACSNQNSQGFLLNGELEVSGNFNIQLMQLGIDNAMLLDSAKTKNDKFFELRAPLSQPALFTLRIKEYDDIFLVIHPEDELLIDIDNAINPIAYTVKGSTDSRLVNEIMTKHKRVRDKITQLSIDYENSKRNPENFEKQKIKFDSIYDNLLANHKTITKEFIHNNPRSLACIFALYQNFGRQRSQALFDSFEDIEIFNFVDSNLTVQYPKTEAVIALNRDVTKIKEQIKHKNFSENLVSPGRKSPDFLVKSLEGVEIFLKQFEGEPVVYFFFAVWNNASVLEALELNNIIKKYPFRQLNLIGISLDSSPEELKNFIDENEISYPIASDFNYWNSEYVHQFGLQSVPDIILLDKNHLIHKRGINSQELFQILSEWKKSKLF